MLTLNAALPSQHSFLQDHDRCTRGRCALLCTLSLLLALSKLLSSEFLIQIAVMKIYYKNNSEFQEIITKYCTAKS